MSHRKQTYTSITPLNTRELAGRWKRRELAGQGLSEESYLDCNQVDTAEPLTATELYEGELPAGTAVTPLDGAELSGNQYLEQLADLATGVQPINLPAELQEIENLELLAGIYEDQLPMSGEEGLVREALGLDLLIDLELRAGETGDPLVASDEGATYVPPIDPPVIPGHAGSRVNAEIASGLGTSALDEPYDESHHSSFLPSDDEVSARVREALRADSSTSYYASTIAIETRDSVVILRGVVDDLIDNDNVLAVASDVAGVTEVVDMLRVRGMKPHA